MDSGYLQSNGEIIYSLKKKKSPLPVAKKGDVRLTTNAIAPAACQAWRCGSCRRIIIDYGEDQVKDSLLSAFQ